MEKHGGSCSARALEIYKEGYSLKTIETMLQREGWKDKDLVESMCMIKLMSYKKRKNRGVIIMSIGGFLLISGFIVTVYLFHKNYDFNCFMYSFTSAGTLLMGYGAYEVLH